MKSGSGLVIGLSLVFGCLFLALVAELYYLLWWKKRITHRESEAEEEEETESYGSRSNSKSSKNAKEFLHFACWKKPPGPAKPDPNPGDPELGEEKDSHSFLKASAGGGGGTEESVESELMRLHNLAGPPRFLFTIKEEEKEDLESECERSRKGSRTRSLSDALMAVDTAPLFTPLASPRFSNPLESYNRQGFNPLFESTMDSDLNNRVVSSSPPPKFKFLRDAEEKLLRRLLEEAGGGSPKDSKPLYPAVAAAEAREGSFLGFLYAKNRDVVVHRLPQVIPLEV